MAPASILSSPFRENEAFGSWKGPDGAFIYLWSPGVCSSKSWKFSPTYLWTEWDLDKQLDIQSLHLSKIQASFFLQKTRLAETCKRYSPFFSIVCVTSVLQSWRVTVEPRASGTASHTWRVQCSHLTKDITKVEYYHSFPLLYQCIFFLRFRV